MAGSSPSSSDGDEESPIMRYFAFSSVVARRWRSIARVRVTPSAAAAAAKTPTFFARAFPKAFSKMSKFSKVSKMFRLKPSVARSSEYGEAFSPVAHPRLVKAAQLVTLAYISFDIVHEAWQLRQSMASHGDATGTWSALGLCVAQRALFHSIASIALPSVTIHLVVHQMQHLCHRLGRAQAWAPSLAGLAVIPFLPLYDYPVETAVDKFTDVVVPDSLRSAHAAVRRHAAHHHHAH